VDQIEHRATRKVTLTTVNQIQQTKNLRAKLTCCCEYFTRSDRAIAFYNIVDIRTEIETPFEINDDRQARRVMARKPD